MTRPMRWLWLGLLLAHLTSAAERKVAVYAFVARGEAGPTAADLATRAAVAALGAPPGWVASTVRPATDQPARGWLALGELGRQVAEATGAEWVLFGNLFTPAGARTVLLSCCAWQQPRREIHLVEPLRLPAPSSRGSADFERAVADHLGRARRRWACPVGHVTESQDDGREQVVRLTLDGPLPAAAGYAAARRPPALLAETSGDRFAPPVEPLGLARLIRGEGASSWFALAPAPAVEAGATLVIAPDGPALATGPGAVLTSRPWGAVASLGGQVVGLTPCWLPLPVAGEVDLRLEHPQTLPWQRRLGDEARAAGVLDVLLSPADRGAEPRPARGVAVRVESRPSGAEVLLDGLVKGLTPLVLGGLEGRPQLTIRRDGYQPWSGQVVATGPLTIRAELEPAFGGLEVVTTPPGLPLFVDGQRQGVTPLRLTGVPIGRHEVRLLGPADRPVTREVNLAAGQTERLVIDFTAAVADPTPPNPLTPLPADQPTNPLPPTVAPLRVSKVTFDRKVTIGSATLHLVGAQVAGGTLVSLTMAPARTSLTEPVAGGFLVTWPTTPGATRQTWTPPDLPELAGLELGPAADQPDLLTVRLKLAPGVVAKVHDSSTLERVRLILYHPAGRQ